MEGHSVGQREGLCKGSSSLSGPFPGAPSGVNEDYSGGRLRGLKLRLPGC